MRIALAAALALPLLATPARAGVYNPQGFLCSYSWIEGTTWEVEAGPVVFADEERFGDVHSGRITCTFQVGGARHSDPDATVVPGPVSPVAAVVPPTVVTVAAAMDDYVYVCSRLDVDGTTLYYDDDARSWSSDPDVPCNLPVAVERRPTVFDTLNDLGCTALGASPAATTELQEAWEDCEDAARAGAVVLARSGGTVRALLPPGYACSDARTGAALATGDAVSAPDPAVACTPVGVPTQRCGQRIVGGRQSGTDPLTVTNACGSDAVTRSVYVDGPGVPMPAPGSYGMPWRCSIDEPPAPADYTVFCALAVR